MSSTQHEHCWNLLPWFVIGRVSASDAQSIERHILDCPACRIELEQQRRLCDAIRRDEPVMLAPQASLQKLMARIDESVPEPHSVVSEMTSEEARAPRPARRVPHWLAIAASVQAIAIAALLAILWQQTTSELTAPRFTTQTSPSAIRAEHALVRIVFRPEMTTGELQSLLRANQAQVLAGPTEAGVYTLQMNEPRAAGDLTTTLTHLRADTNVVFAELVQGETP